MAVGGTLYVGTDKTNVVALRAADGKILWQFDSPGAIKASPSYHDGRVYVADYEAAMFCLDADTGKLNWRTNTTQGAAVRRGRLLLLAGDRLRPASTPPATTAPSTPSTKRPARSTGPSRPAAPSTDRRPSPRCPARRRPSTSAPTTALLRARREDRQGALAFDVGGPVPGTATVIGQTVYTSSFKTREAIGIDTHTQRKTFEMNQAGYTPMVSDGKRLYLIGYYTLIGLQPTRP